MIEPYLAAGFERFPKMPHEPCQDVAAKTIYIDGRRAFTIVVRYYCLPELEIENICADVQYNVHADDKPVFNVDLLHAESPEQVIQFFKYLWLRMDCAFYD